MDLKKRVPENNKTFRDRMTENNAELKKRMNENNAQFKGRMGHLSDKKAPEEHEPKPSNTKPWYKHWWGVLVALAIWPFFAIWFVWKKTKWNKAGKIGATAVVLTGVVLEFMAMAAFAPPSVAVNSSTAATKDIQYHLTADIYPYDSVVTVNGKQVSLGDQGKLSTEVSLNEGDNQITIVATKGKNVTQQAITVHRYTKDELAAQAKKAADAKAAADKAAADKKAASDKNMAAISASEAQTAKDKAAIAAKAAQDQAAADAAAKAQAAVPAEYKSALSQADSYANTQNMSKQGVYDQLVSQYGGQFSAAAAQYAIDNVVADWNANALAKAKDYQSQQSLSPAAIHDQLTSSYGEKFTQAEADYAIQHLND